MIVIHNNEALGITREQMRAWFELSGEKVEVIHRGRNQIRLIRDADDAIVIKEFSATIKKRLVYAFRKSKARKSFENAMVLLERGIETPLPYGYMEERGTFNALLRCEYICRYECRLSLDEAIARYGPVCLRHFAEFVGTLHATGIRHDDLNNSNVRVAVDENNNYNFSLIDLNRMKIYPPDTKVPEKECFSNICRFCSLDSGYIYFVKKYLEARNMDIAALASAVKAKQRHDRKVDIKNFLKQIITR